MKTILMKDHQRIVDSIESSNEVVRMEYQTVSQNLSRENERLNKIIRSNDPTVGYLFVDNKSGKLVEIRVGGGLELVGEV